MDSERIAAVCREAREAAALRPGRYGGRYVASRWNAKTKEHEYVVLGDDDPDLYRDDESLDIFAQATPTRVLPIGRARHWLTEQGTVREVY